MALSTPGGYSSACPNQNAEKHCIPRSGDEITLGFCSVALGLGRNSANLGTIAQDLNRLHFGAPKDSEGEKKQNLSKKNDRRTERTELNFAKR